MKQFTIQAKTGEVFTCRVVLYSLKWQEPSNKTLSLKFLTVGKDFGGEYEYVWSSSPMAGLSWIKKDSLYIYDPYKLSNSSEGVLMEEVGRELSVIFLASLLPGEKTYSNF